MLPSSIDQLGNAEFHIIGRVYNLTLSKSILMRPKDVSGCRFSKYVNLVADIVELLKYGRLSVLITELVTAFFTSLK